jgi:hypothetical protein
MASINLFLEHSITEPSLREAILRCRGDVRLNINPSKIVCS